MGTSGPFKFILLPPTVEVDLLEASTIVQHTPSSRERVRSAILRGARSTYHDEKGLSALHHATQAACKSNNSDILDLMLYYGLHADLQTNSDHMTCLHYAVAESNTEVARCLLQRRAAVNIADRQGRRPIHLAARKNDRDMVNLLLSFGANLENKDSEGRSAMDIALDHENTHVAMRMAHSLCKTTIWARLTGDGSERNRLRPTLYKAVELDKVHVARALIKGGVGVNFTDRPNGNTLLHVATERDGEDMVRLLLESKMQMDIVSHTHGTALVLASYMGYGGIANILLDAGASVDILVGGTWTALHAAASRGHMDIVESLLAKGANKGLKNSSGLTARNYAEEMGHMEIGALLLEGYGCTLYHMDE